MPRPFSEEEKKQIRNLLIEAGKDLFCRYGLKKTGISDLAKAASIAQGSFYLFFGSKEELYFEIMELEEKLIREKFIKWLMNSGKLTRAKFREFLHLTIKVFEENQLIRRLWMEDELDELLRRLPPELMERHNERDISVMEPLIKHWQNEGTLIEGDAEVIAGVIRSLFLLPLHHKEIGQDSFPAVIDMYIGFIADGLVKEDS